MKIFRVLQTNKSMHLLFRVTPSSSTCMIQDDDDDDEVSFVDQSFVETRRAPLIGKKGSF